MRSRVNQAQEQHSVQCYSVKLKYNKEEINGNLHQVISDSINDAQYCARSFVWISSATEIITYLMTQLT